MESKLWKFIKHTLELLNKAYDVSMTHLVKRDPEKKKKSIYCSNNRRRAL